MRDTRTTVSLPWPAEDVDKAKRIASAAGWSAPEIEGFVNGLADLPGPAVDLLAAVGLATETREMKWSRPWHL